MFSLQPELAQYVYEGIFHGGPFFSTFVIICCQVDMRCLFAHDEFILVKNKKEYKENHEVLLYAKLT